MIKYKGRVASIAPYLYWASVSIAALSIGFAANTVSAETVNSAIVGPKTFSLNENNTVASNGQIAVTSGTNRAVLLSPDPYDFTFTNNGLIDFDGSGLTSNLFGMEIGGAVSSTGSFINNGTIDAFFLGSGTRHDVYATYFSKTFDGTFLNTGTIKATAGETTPNAIPGGLGHGAGAFGVFFESAVSNATITNEGLISANAANAGESAFAAGFYFLAATQATFVNDGTINISAFGGSENNLFGFYADDTFDGNITNNGTVRLRSSGGTSTLSAQAFLIDGDYTGNFENNGLIDVNVQAEYYDSAIGFYARGEVVGNFVNNQTIRINYTGGSSVNAAGLEARQNFNGNVTNTGRVTVNAIGGTAGVSGDGDANAFGLMLVSNVSMDAFTGDFLNTGTISVDAEAKIGNALAIGFGVGDNGDADFLGRFTNRGTMTVNADAVTSSAGASAYGLRVQGVVTGGAENSGSLKVEANGYEATAYGMYFGGDVSGGIENSGDISVIANADKGVDAGGIYVNGSISDGGLLNSGLISLESDDLDDDEQGTGEYYLIGVNDSVTGDFVNSGTLRGTVDVYTADELYGMYSRLGVSGDFLNTGSITLNGDFSTAEGEIYAMYSADDIGGDFGNDGLIDIDALSSSENSIGGMYVQGAVGGDVYNTGTIDLRSIDLAVTDASSADAVGIYIADDVGGVVSNSGLIRVYAENTEFDDGAQAIGIEITADNLSADVVNSGSIIVTQIGAIDTSEVAIGIHIDGFSGTFRNEALISVKGDNDGQVRGLFIDTLTGSIDKVGTILTEDTDNAADAYAIYLGSGSGTVSIDTTDTVQGLIRVDAHSTTLTSKKGSGGYFEFEDASPGTAEYTTIVEAGADPWFVINEGLSNPIYTTYGQEVFLSQSMAVAQMVDLSDYLVDLSASFGGTVPDGLTAAKSGRNLYPFVRTELSFANTDDVSGLNIESDVFTFQVGALSQTQNSGNFGVMLSAYNSDTEVFSSSSGLKDAEADGVGYGLDLAYTQLFEQMSLTFGLHMGTLEADQERFNVGGTATSTSDNTWVGFSIAGSTSYDLSNGWTGVPSLKASVTSFKFGGYTETGTSPALATVEDRTSVKTQGEIGFAIRKAIQKGTFKFGGSIYSSNWSGDDAASVTIATSTQDVSSLNREGTGVELFAGLENYVIGNGAFDFGGTFDFDSDGHQGIRLSAQYQFNF